MKICAQQQAGLTRLEVTALAICGVVLLGLMVLLILPGFARAKTGRHEPQRRCVNNLRQVGLSYLLWANDNEGRFPFASTNTNSSLAWLNSTQVFRHYRAISNELVTPKVLNCYADKNRIKASDFAQLSNTNLSYFVGLDAQPDNPQSILSGDRNITGGTLSNGFLRVLGVNSEAGWTKEIHQNAGNVGLGDGSVQQLTPMRLRQQIARAMTNSSFIRLAVP